MLHSTYPRAAINCLPTTINSLEAPHSLPARNAAREVRLPPALDLGHLEQRPCLRHLLEIAQLPQQGVGSVRR